MVDTNCVVGLQELGLGPSLCFVTDWSHSAVLYGNRALHFVTAPSYCVKYIASEVHIHCVSKKRPTFKLSLTLSNLNRFSKFLHCWKAYEICYKSHMTIPTLP